MSFKVFVYLHIDGSAPFYDWYLDHKIVPVVQRGKLNQKLDSLNLHGEGLRPQVMCDCGITNVAKLRVHGDVQLRPKLCKISNIEKDDKTDAMVKKDCFVLLLGAKEISGKWHPSNAPGTANTYRSELLKDHIRRKIPYVRYQE